MRSGCGSSLNDCTQRTDDNPPSVCTDIIGALPHATFLPRNNSELAACKTLAKTDFTMRQLYAFDARNRQIILTCFAGRLAHDLHAVALGTKHRIHKGLPFFGSEALEAGRHDAQARTARLDGRGLERR